MDKAGRPTEIPSDIDDDENDSLRYLIMNAFPFKGKVIDPSFAENENEGWSTMTSLAPGANGSFRIADLIEKVVQETEPEEKQEPAQGKKGGFFFDL